METGHGQMGIGIVAFLTNLSFLRICVGHQPLHLKFGLHGLGSLPVRIPTLVGVAEKLLSNEL